MAARYENGAPARPPSFLPRAADPLHGGKVMSVRTRGTKGTRGTRGTKGTRDASGVVERLEPRRLLTYVINANPSTQNFYELDVRSNGNVYNFGTLIATGATDVQVNGGPMLDEVVVDRAELPIVFNGGGGGDFCYLGGNPSSPNELSLITSTVTFHGTASAGDKVGIIDSAHTTNATYTVNGNSFNRQGMGQISWDTSVELLTLSTGSGTNQINVTGAPTTTSMTLSGNTAPDTLYADWSAGSSSIDFFGGVSGGGDIAQLDDTAYVGISQPVYSLAAGSVIRTSIPSRGF